MPQDDSRLAPAPDAASPTTPSPLMRVLGMGLLVATFAPLHRLLSAAHAGPAGVQTRAAAEAAWTSGLLGTAMVVVLAVALTRLLGSFDPADRGLASLDRLVKVPAGRFALGVVFLTLFQGVLVAWAVHGTNPTSVDEVVQLLHARALLEGGVALPMEGPAAAWATLNSVVTPHGWASIYPPLHTAWLALWLGLGAAWLAGPVAIAVGAGLTALAADAVMADRRAARLGGLLVAFTPYVLALGSTHLSHASAMALLAGVFLCAARARDGGPGWAVATGAMVGAAVSARPWMALVVASAVLTSLWLPTGLRAGTRWMGTRVAGLALGGLPFAAFLFWWNAHLFGHPLRLGYTAAFGPAHGLGLHRDPWGNRYGVQEAIGYTGADLVQLGAHLLETPLPALALVGAALLVARPARGTGVLLTWALAGLGANALYWHHGVHMGPRLLFETAPAWVLLWASASVSLATPHGRVATVVRRGAAWVVLLSLVGGAVLAPGVLSAYRSASPTLVPAPPGAEPAVVFVHGSWPSRVANRLAAAGMRRDSVETALRRNDLCAVEQYARDRSSGSGPGLSLEALPGTPSHLRGRALAPGVVVRADPTHTWDEGCIREARADRFGTVELEPLAWRSDAPTGRLLLVRDLGPAENARTLEAHGDRTPWIWMAGPDGESPTLLPYAEGMELLWMGAASGGFTGDEAGS